MRTIVTACVCCFLALAAGPALACPNLSGRYLCPVPKEDRQNPTFAEYVNLAVQQKTKRKLQGTEFAPVTTYKFIYDGTEEVFATYLDPQREDDDRSTNAFCSDDGKMLVVDQVYRGWVQWTPRGPVDGSDYFKVVHYHIKLDARGNLLWNSEVLANTSPDLRMKIVNYDQRCRRATR